MISCTTLIIPNRSIVEEIAKQNTRCQCFMHCKFNGPPYPQQQMSLSQTNQAIVDQFKHHRLVAADILPRLVVDFSTDFGLYTQQQQSVCVDRILCEPWNAYRLSQAKTLLAAGKTPPPIELNAYKLFSTSWYTVTDGIHRVVSYRDAGKKRIKARIQSYQICQPDRFRLVPHSCGISLICITKCQSGVAIETLRREHSIDLRFISLLKLVGVHQETQLVGFPIIRSA